MQRLFTTERLMLAFFVLGSFVGIWHALPMVNVVADEQYYVGGVLRALEAHSLLPQGNDVPYGLLTFYLNYALQVPFLALLFVLKGFNTSRLMQFLVLNPAVNYAIPRLVSAVVVSAFALFYNRFLRHEGLSLLHRTAVLSVLFCTVLSTAILHTGKMWVLTMVLVMVSLLLLYRALALRATDEAIAARAGQWSIFLSFLAFVNFSLTGFFFINIPILLYAFWGNRLLCKKMIQATALGIGAVVLSFVINYQGFVADIGGFFTKYHPLKASAVLPQITFFHSLELHGLQLFETLPLTLLLLAIASMHRAVKNKVLWYLSVVYAVIYFVVVALVATWYTSPSEELRYFVVYGFFFSGMVAALDFKKMRRYLRAFLVLQVMVYLYMLFLLVAPTTYNAAFRYIQAQYASSSMLIYNDVPELSLPENAETSGLRQDQFCGTKCAHLRAGSATEPFVPVVVTYQSQLNKVVPATFPQILWISSSALVHTCAGTPITSFQSGASDTNYVSIEYNLGNYFLPDFWHLSRLGKNVYLYQVTPECMAELPRKVS